MTAVVFDHVRKHYRGAGEYRALRDDVMGAVKRLTGVRRPERRVVKALDDVSFEVPEGRSYALVGDNGAGKTTALKIASRIAYPSEGVVRIRGRVGALIEVGTGMHPELTGRENVHLYGRILGLGRRDIAARFDQITTFADIGAAIDQPVKQYSSGMQLRIGFAVAAHLDPEVLLVDEAIAVGDAGFQYRCVERMRELVDEGRTLVFVSHDLGAIETLCHRALLLDHGQVADEGPAGEVVRRYLLRVQERRLDSTRLSVASSGHDLEVTEVELLDGSGLVTDRIGAGEGLTVRLHYRALRPVPRPLFSVGIGLAGGIITLASMLVDGEVPERLDGEGYVDCRFSALPLNPQVYEVWASVRGSAGYGDLVAWQRVKLFAVRSDDVAKGVGGNAYTMNNAPVVVPYSWGGDMAR